LKIRFAVKLQRDRDKSEWGSFDEVLRIVEMTDIIEVDRNNFRHFVMYWKEDPIFNRGLCIHINKENGSGRKHLEHLDEVVRRNKCRINNLGKEAKSRGLSELPKEQQIAIALEGLSDQDFVDCYYSLVNNNCEKQVTEWKYGIGNGFSKQVLK
jgi:hypothetical protein